MLTFLFVVVALAAVGAHVAVRKALARNEFEQADIYKIPRLLLALTAGALGLLALIF